MGAGVQTADVRVQTHPDGERGRGGAANKSYVNASMTVGRPGAGARRTATSDFGRKCSD